MSYYFNFIEIEFIFRFLWHLDQLPSTYCNIITCICWWNWPRITVFGFSVVHLSFSKLSKKLQFLSKSNSSICSIYSCLLVSLVPNLIFYFSVILPFAVFTIVCWWNWPQISTLLQCAECGPSFCSTELTLSSVKRTFHKMQQLGLITHL